MEHYLIVLNNYVRNKAKLEGCMASSYMYDEALRFCTQYFALYPHTERCIWDLNEEECDATKVLHGVGKPKRQSTQ